MRKNQVTGTLFVLMGTILMLAGILMDTARVNPGNSHSRRWVVVTELLVTLGTGALSLGVLGIILGFRDWQDYFKERLADVIQQKSYVKSLSTDELQALQAAALGEYFGVEYTSPP